MKGVKGMPLFRCTECFADFTDIYPSKINGKTVCNDCCNEHLSKQLGKQIPIKPMPTVEPLNKYKLIGESIGKLVDEKNKQYGDSFNKSAEFLKILYPNGVPVEHYSDMLGIIRVFDKLMRIANGNQGNENGWNDICGYSILKSAE